ncbi:MAG TPA: hypothetical protein VK484_14515 [Ferruginibacter sp.]|nr:hypothetical protein [Ferruginibacter sp.]
MKKQRLQKMITWLRLCIAGLVMVILSLFLFSFEMKKLHGDFLKQLGINQEMANSKITNSLLGGYLDYYDIRNLHRILVNDRAAIVKDIAAHAKEYVNSEGFKKEYMALKLSNKPSAGQKVETPEEMRASMIKMAKEFVRTSEEGVKNASPEMKKMFEGLVETAKKNLKEAEDPNNKNIKFYTQNYESMKKNMQAGYDMAIKRWEAKYPADHLQYIKVRLQSFLDATADVDFSARLFEKKGIKYFVDPQYERKDNRWKMAFRAGKDAVEAGRAFAKQWLAEIK